MQSLNLFSEGENGSQHVRFIRSFTDAEKRQLLQDCTAVVYTPSLEHFGIVPLETMAAMRPVIAVNNGGPLETIVDGVTGFLCDPTPQVSVVPSNAFPVIVFAGLEGLVYRHAAVDWCG